LPIEFPSMRPAHVPGAPACRRRFGAALLLACLAAGCGESATVPPPVEVVEVFVTPTGVVLNVGESRSFSARTLDARGEEVHGRVVIWSSRPEGRLAVSTDGVAIALSPGYAEVVATVEGREGTATVTIPNP